MDTNAEPESQHTHSYSTDWKSTDAEHCKACECGDKQYAGAHVDSNQNGSCDICGYQMAEAEQGGCGSVMSMGAAVAVTVLAGAWLALKKKED